MCKNFLSLDNLLEIGFFIHENSNISGIINTNNYQIFVSHINNVGFEQNRIFHSVKKLDGEI